MLPEFREKTSMNEYFKYNEMKISNVCWQEPESTNSNWLKQ